jgi:hypothetical protein
MAEKVGNEAQKAHEGELTPSEKASAEVPEILTSTNNSLSSDVAPEEALKQQPVTAFAIILGAIASIGGFIFGYESGQISGKPANPICSHRIKTNI